MLSRKNNEWHLCTHKVVCIQYGAQHEKYTANSQWWLDFARKWEHTTIISIDDVTYTDEQIERYEQIKYLPEDFGDVYAAYVATGEVLEDSKIPQTHPFNVVILKNKDLKQLETENADLWYENILLKNKADINEREIADLWYQILAGGNV